MQSRIFNITATTGEVAISGLALLRGKTAEDGGAIRSAADLTLNASTVSGEITNGGSRYGSAISGGKVTINQSTISGETSNGSGGSNATISNGTVRTAGSNNGSNSPYAIYAGDLSLTNSMVSGGGIYGNRVSLTDSTISGGGIHSYTAYGRGGFVTLTNSGVSGHVYCGWGSITLTNSTSSGGISSYFGTGVTVAHSVITGDGIWARSTSNITLTNSIVQNSQNGIYTNDTDVTIDSCTITGNQGRGIAFWTFNANPGRLLISNSLVSGNLGGGILICYSRLQLSNSVVTANIANSTEFLNYGSRRGGGIFSIGSDVDILSSVISNNEGLNGGGIWADQSDVRISNSTVSRNAANPGGVAGYLGRGGGILCGESTSILLNSSTVSGNTALADGGGIITSFSDNGYSSDTILNSIVANNTSGSSNPDLSLENAELVLRYSLIGDNAGTSLSEAQTPDANGNLIGSSAGAGVIDPLLAPLADNGGPTQTHALLAGSPAIDAGDPLLVGPPDFDQRGAPFARVAAGRRDMGAFEVQSVDFGDAPDAAAGTGPGDYRTRLVDDGPWHTIVAGLHMGARIDMDDGTLQNSAANADDVDGAWPDDEDGLVNPTADLVLTVDTQPTVNVWITNTTSTAATLYGWIDYNADGWFDNATEHASVVVPAGTDKGIVELAFPTVPVGSIGTTYARFRLSTDAAAANPWGAAIDGEVEDYRVEITNRSGGTANSAKTHKIASGTSNGPTLADGDLFGISVASLGDLDGDGVADVVVGAESDNTGGANRGAIHVLFLNADGTVKSTKTIASATGGGPTLANNDRFGRSVASLGDLDGDGVSDLAVGADLDDAGGVNRGAVYILLLNSDGTVKSSQKISSVTVVGITDGDFFGRSLTSLGDLDGDGVTDLAVGANGDDTGGNDRGAVHVLLLNANGTMKSSQKTAGGSASVPLLANDDQFGAALASLGDLDGDGVTELVVGAIGNDTGGSGRGAAHVLFLNSDGTVKTSQTIASGTGGLPVLANEDQFGSSLEPLGDLDGDGVMDLAVGAIGNDTGGSDRGAVHVLFLNANGTVKSSRKIASGTDGGPTTTNVDRFGRSIARLGDLDGDGIVDIVVGASADDTGGTNRGAAYVLFLSVPNTPPVFSSADIASIAENSTAIMTVTATDVHLPGQTVTLSIAGGVDQARFGMTSSGALSFNSAPDFEAPTDADGDNIYQLIVQASDGEGGTTTQTISVTVTPVNDISPLFTSLDTAAVPENTTLVMNITAIDADLPPQALAFSIVGGADQSKFSITSGSELSFNAAPDFEAPADANGDNVYVLIVEASDGSRTSLQALLVTVTNVSEPPALLGDYNRNGNVDAADYVYWRKTLGTMGLPAYSGADGDGDSTIDSGDYSAWTTHFGRSLPGGGGSGSAVNLVERSVGRGHLAPEEPASLWRQPAVNIRAPSSRMQDEIRTSLDQTQPPLSKAERSAAQFTHDPFSRRGVNVRLTKLVSTNSDAHRDDGFIAWLAGLDCQQLKQPREVANSVSTAKPESTLAGAEAAIDDVFQHIGILSAVVAGTGA